ncbi:MAG: hypothetical protein ACP5K1_05615, partial [Candidatus Bathyarchaeia archaeon]
MAQTSYKSKISWQSSYRKKLKELDEAIDLIKVGDRIFVGSACGEPQYLVKGLVEKGE